MELLRRLAPAVLLVGLLTPQLRAQDLEQALPDPESLDALARVHRDDVELGAAALNRWLQEVGAALTEKRFDEATSRAERAWMLYQELQEPRQGRDYARYASLTKMALAKAAHERGDAQHAASLYREAGELHPDPRAFVSAGQIAGRMEEWHQARRDFEQALSMEGVSPEAYLRLGETLYQLGETERAIEAVEQGVAQGASRTQAEAYLSRFRREAEVEDGYSQGGTLHFVVSFEDVDQQQDFLRRVEASLERVYERVCRFLDKYPQNRVPVVIYPSASQYQAASGAPTWTAAVYNGKVRVPTGELATGDDAALDRILAHEFAHYLIERLAGKGAPAWLQEGLAQHVEADGEAPSWIPGYGRRLLQAYRRKPMPIKLAQLEGSFHGASGGGVQAAYTVSYYAVGYLLQSGGMFRLHNFMVALSEGKPTEEALDLELFLDYAQLDEKWQAHARSELRMSP